MKLSELVIGLFMAGIMATGLVGFYTSAAANAGITLGEAENLTTFKHIDALFNQTNTTYQATKGVSSNLPFADIAGLMINAFNVLKLMLVSVGIIPSIIADTTQILGFEPWLYIAVWGIVMVVIISMLVAAALNRSV